MSTYSGDVADGNDATDDQYNNLRKDALEMYLALDKSGAISVANGQAYTLVPQKATVIKIWVKCEAGSGLIRIKSGATTIKASDTIETTASSTISFDSTALVAGAALTFDIISATGLSGIHVVVMARRDTA